MSGRGTYKPNPLVTAAYKAQQKQQNTSGATEQPTSTADSDTPYRWQDDAACKNLGHHMFPRRHKDISYITQARQICRGCPVKEECLEEALDYPTTDMHGVWAGLTPRQLAAEQKKRGIIPTKPTIAQIWAEFAKQEPS